MRIKKISSDKIVVQLSDSDLERFDLDFCERAPEAADLHKFLYEVMELVKIETGFDPYSGGQVIVEASMSPTGLSLIISKIRTGKRKMTREEFKKVKRISAKKKTPRDAECARTRVYIFDSFDDFENAVAAVPTDGFSGDALYRNGDGYALIASKQDGVEHNIMSEFASHTSKNEVLSFSIDESWTLVATGDALLEMTENIRKMNLL